MLGADDLSIDVSAPIADLDTTLAGQPLSITWKPSADSGSTVGAGTVEGDFHGLYATDYAGDAADASDRFAGQACDGAGGVGTGVLINTTLDGAEEAQPLSALQLPVGTTFRC